MCRLQVAYNRAQSSGEVKPKITVMLRHRAPEVEAAFKAAGSGTLPGGTAALAVITGCGPSTEGH